MTCESQNFICWWAVSIPLGLSSFLVSLLPLNTSRRSFIARRGGCWLFGSRDSKKSKSHSQASPWCPQSSGLTEPALQDLSLWTRSWASLHQWHMLIRAVPVREQPLNCSWLTALWGSLGRVSVSLCIAPAFVSSEFAFLKSGTSAPCFCVVFPLILNWIRSYSSFSPSSSLSPLASVFSCSCYLDLILYLGLASVGWSKNVPADPCWSHSILKNVFLPPLSYILSASNTYQFISLCTFFLLAFILLPLDAFASCLPSSLLSTYWTRDPSRDWRPACIFCADRTVHLSTSCINITSFTEWIMPR